MSTLSHLHIPQRIAGFALTASLLVLGLLGLAHFRGEILVDTTDDASSTASSLRSQPFVGAPNLPRDEDSSLWVTPPVDPPADDSSEAAVPDASDATTPTSEQYFVFLAKYPLQNSWRRLFHTEVIVCPRENFSNDSSFLDMLDGLLDTMMPSRFDNGNGGDVTGGEQDTTKLPFAAIEKDQWSKQSETGCVQLGYGGANCGISCCGSPSKYDNRNYALSSQTAVISNAMSEYKELYFYGVSGSSEIGVNNGISGEDAYKAVCHGHMNAIEMGGKLPKCVSNWAGRDYNPITNNCNTYTSTVLKCVYGLSDAKPHLGVSDLITVTCPKEKNGNGSEVDQCVIPTMDGNPGVNEEKKAEEAKEALLSLN